MAKKHLLISSRLVERFPALRTISWRFEAIFLKSLVKLIQLRSPEGAEKAANFLFRNFAPWLPVAKKIRGNLMVAFPDKDDREINQLVRQACGNLGVAAVELALAERLWVEREERIEFVMENGVDLTGYKGRPAVLVTGHIGAWQISTFVGKPFGIHITSVYAPEENPYLREFFYQLRKKMPTRFISRDGCMRVLTKELKQGNAVGLVSDTRVDGGEVLSFFGIPTPTNTTAARLAIRNTCDLFPVRAERLPGMKYRITVFPAIRPDNLDAPVADQAGQMTQKLLDHFEAWIRDDPDQWMCFGRRWPPEAYTGVSKNINDPVQP
jgi:KDO2-lipid IV(A) lauroyltransferase